jgi:hypothetical protein
MPVQERRKNSRQGFGEGIGSDPPGRKQILDEAQEEPPTSRLRNGVSQTHQNHEKQRQVHSPSGNPRKLLDEKKGQNPKDKLRDFHSKPLKIIKLSFNRQDAKNAK